MSISKPRMRETWAPHPLRPRFLRRYDLIVPQRVGFLRWNEMSGKWLQCAKGFVIPSGARNLLENCSRADPSLRSGFRLRAPAPLTPAQRLNM